MYKNTQYSRLRLHCETTMSAAALICHLERMKQTTFVIAISFDNLSSQQIRASSWSLCFRIMS